MDWRVVGAVEVVVSSKNSEAALPIWTTVHPTENDDVDNNNNNKWNCIFQLKLLLIPILSVAHAIDQVHAGWLQQVVGVVDRIVVAVVVVVGVLSALQMR